MIVRLTVGQANAVNRAVASARRDLWLLERLSAWLGLDVVRASKHRLDVAMPAIAWRAVEDILFDACYDERGFRRQGTKVTLLNASKVVRRSLNAREQHPALSRKAAMGMISEMIPAWRFPGPEASGKLYSPYPSEALKFTVLAPEVVVVKGQRVTKWVESAASIDRRLLLCEETHLELVHE